MFIVYLCDEDNEAEGSTMYGVVPIVGDQLVFRPHGPFSDGDVALPEGRYMVYRREISDPGPHDQRYDLFVRKME